MPTTVTMTAQGVVDMLAAAASGLEPVILRQVAVAGELVKKVMQEKAPVGVGGDEGLRGSIQATLDKTNLGVEIKPTVDYGDAVETGSKPHWAPHGPDSSLAAWAKLKGINVYAVAASIAKKGTKPHPYIVPTYDETQVEVAASFVPVVDVFLRSLVA